MASSALRLRSPPFRRFPSRPFSLSSPSPLDEHLSDNGDDLPIPTSDPLLSASQTALLHKLHHLIKDHFHNNPIDSTNLTSGFTIPSLTSSLSLLSPPSSPLPLPLLHHLIRTCASTPHVFPFPQTLSLFNWWISTVHLPSSDLTQPFHALIDFAGKARAFAVAWNLLDEMRDRGVPLTTHTFLSVIRRYTRAGLSGEAIVAFSRMEEYNCHPDHTTFSLVIAILSEGRSAVDAQAFFDRFKDRFPPDVVVYTALIRAWCRAYRIDEAERVFVEMKENRIVPNVYTYTIVIDALSRAGQINRAHEVFVQMLDAGCTPNAVTFNTLMRVHVKTGCTEKVLQVFNQMKRMGCEPSEITYNFLIATHCRQGNLDAALKVLDQMVLKGCYPNASSFSPIFGCIARLGDVNAALKLHGRMRDANCKASIVTYNFLMEIFVSSKSVDMIDKLKEEMEEEGVAPNVTTYDVLIAMFCAMGNWNRAYQLLMEMVEEKSLKPKDSMSRAVLELLRKSGQTKKLAQVVEKLVAYGFMDGRGR